MEPGGVLHSIAINQRDLMAVVGGLKSRGTPETYGSNHGSATLVFTRQAAAEEYVLKHTGADGWISLKSEA
jgi:hypothetical protein